MASTFAEDILPKFRGIDQGCMAPKGVLLGSAEWMCDPAGNDEFADHANARRVYGALSTGFMPPGHKWSRDWLDSFDSWMTDGFKP